MFLCLNLHASYKSECSNGSTILIAKAVPLGEHKAIAFKGVCCCSLESISLLCNKLYHSLESRLYDEIIAVVPNVLNLAGNVSRVCRFLLSASRKFNLANLCGAKQLVPMKGCFTLGGIF